MAEITVVDATSTTGKQEVNEVDPVSAPLFASILATTKVFKRITSGLLSVLKEFSAIEEKKWMRNLLEPVMQRIGIIDKEIKVGKVRVDLMDFRALLLVTYSR